MKRLLVAVPLALVGAAWFYVLVLPWPVLLRWRNPGTTAFMEQRLDEAAVAGDTLELRHEWVPLDGISQSMQRAVVVAEDGNFRDHAGIDWAALSDELDYRGDDDFSLLDPADIRAVFGAIRYYLENRDEVRGRSTITQQLAKNLYFSENRSVLRKLDEFIVAKRLEWFLSKDRILELYLNAAEWGPGIFGVGAAARHYFDTTPAELTRSQAAALAATLPHPLTSNPAHRPGRMRWRQDLILARMGGRGPVETVPLAPEPVEIEAPAVDLRIDTLPADTLQAPADTAPADSATPGRTDTLPDSARSRVDTMPRPASPPDTTPAARSGLTAPP